MKASPKSLAGGADPAFRNPGIRWRSQLRPPFYGEMIAHQAAAQSRAGRREVGDLPAIPDGGVRTTACRQERTLSCLPCRSRE